MKGGGKVGGECFDIFCAREPGALKRWGREKKVDKIKDYVTLIKEGRHARRTVRKMEKWKSLPRENGAAVIGPARLN